MSNKYYSLDKSRFLYDDVFGALEVIVGFVKVGDIVTIYQGDVVKKLASHYLPDYTNDSMNENACDIHSYDLVKEWPDLDASLEVDLKHTIDEVVNKWFTKNNMHPSFGNVINIKELKYKIISLEDVYGWELIK